MILADRGLLAFTDDVRKFVPELPEYSKDRPIRILDLLQHTSRLADPIGSGQIRDKSSADLLKWVANRKLLFSTGSKHQYSNMNYRLLSIIVERVSGKSLGAFLKAEVFEPLGMTRSVCRESKDQLIEGRAVGYAQGGLLEGGKGYRRLESDFVLSGEAGVWSCLDDDLVHWDAALRGGKLVKPATWKLAWTPGKRDDGKEFNYGLGWFIEQGKQGRKLYHSGGWPGFTTHHVRYLDQQVTVMVLRNFYGSNSATQIAERVATLLLEKPKARPATPVVLDKDERQKLVGVYVAAEGKARHGEKRPFAANGPRSAGLHACAAFEDALPAARPGGKLVRRLQTGGRQGAKFDLGAGGRTAQRGFPARLHRRRHWTAPRQGKGRSGAGQAH
jgi:D-alanyl-D-alanine carboxypeptidase